MGIKHLIATLALAALPAACGPATPDTNEPVPVADTPGLPDLGGRTVTVAVENNYPPFNAVRAATGEPYGWDYDAIGEICRRIRCVPEFVQAPWEGIFEALAAGTYDMAANGVSVTPERRQVVAFSVPYLTVGQTLVVPFATTVDDVEEFTADPENRVGTQVGTTNESAARARFGDDRVATYPDFAAAVAALVAGDIQAVVADTVTAARLVATSVGRLKLGPQYTSDEPLAFAFPPNSDLVAPFDAALRAMQADGNLEAIHARWFRP
jgi:polar amino acid transport system substrate-binding protein